MIKHYICYYNTRRVQRNLGVLTPMEKHAIFPRRIKSGRQH